MVYKQLSYGLVAVTPCVMNRWFIKGGQRVYVRPVIKQVLRSLHRSALGRAMQRCHSFGRCYARIGALLKEQADDLSIAAPRRFMDWRSPCRRLIHISATFD